MADKKIMAIMASGSLNLGMGHIMRTLVIAEKMKSYFNIIYICKSSKEYETGVKELKKQGYEIFYEDNLPSADILLLDSYDVTEEKISHLKSKYKKLIYIDDLHCLSYYDCDIIINKNLNTEKLVYNTPVNCKTLLGTKYAILRSEFREISFPEIKANVNNILITMGGTDPKNTSVKILNILKSQPYNFHIAVSNGFSEKTKNDLKMLSSENKNIILHNDPKMSELISICDIAITANGGTAQEIASLGIPQFAISVADNQNSDMEFGESNGLYIYIGKEKDLPAEKFIALFNSLIKDFEKRKKLSNSEKEKINRFGVDLIETEIKAITYTKEPLIN